MSLALLALSLLSAPPAQAQYPGGGSGGGYPGGGWTVTDQVGNALPSDPNGGGYRLRGPMTGSVSLTGAYPDVFTAAQQPNPTVGYAFIPNPNDYQGWLLTGASDSGYDPYHVWTTAQASNHAGTSGGGTTGYLGMPWNENINGSITSNTGGTLWAVFQWNGSSQPPDHIDVLLRTTVSASAAASTYGNPPQAGGSSTATATDSTFSETATADSGGGGVPLVTGRHLLRVGVDPNTKKAQVSLGGTTTATATASVPYGMMGSYPGTTSGGYYQVTNGAAGANASAFIGAAVAFDSREVAITADVNTTSYKVLTGGVDANGDGKWARVAHTPDPDGTMKGDIGLPYGEQHTTQSSGGIGQGTTSQLVVTSSNRSVTYTGHIPGNWATQNAHYWWNSSLKNYDTNGSLYHLSGVDLPTEAEIPTLGNVYVGPVVDSDHGGAIIPNEAGANGTTDHISFKFQNGDNRPNYPTGNDGDGATGVANYSLTIHQPIEVFPSHKPSEINYRVASPSPTAEETSMSFQGLDYSTYKGNSSNGVSALCVLNSPSLYWSLSSDVTSVLSSVPYPGWWGVLDVIFTGANIAINHATPVQQSFPADFNDVAWSDSQSSGDSYYMAKTYPKAYFHMSPRVRINYRWRYKLVDVYETSGFKSETLQHDEEYVGPQNVFGVFTYFGPGS